MTGQCQLMHAAGTSGVACEKDDCVFWRLAGHLGISETFEGCAVEHFRLLDQGSEMVEWLISVKRRVDQQLS